MGSTRVESAIDTDLEIKAETTLRDTESYRVPVPIHLVAERLHVVVEAAILGPNVSGVLVCSADGARIGYNIAHAKVRQRRTIAHELGHYLLHTKSTGKPEIFVDKHVGGRHRQTISAEGEQKEIEANQLAAALLMPERLLQKDITDLNPDLFDHQAIGQLANRFQVSTVAMALRLSALNLIY
jgi:Zn-dependent peptidase ImmA (M78 family)